MTREDVKKLIAVVTATYPNHFRNYTGQEIDNMVSAWVRVMMDVDYKTADRGLTVYLRSDTKGFPPSPGQIIECMRLLEPDNSMNEMEAWSLVERAVRNSGYASTEEFNKLPQIIRRVIRSPTRLKEWSQMDMADFQTVEQSNFMRSYRAELEREKNNAKVPVAMRPHLAVIKDFPLQIEDRHETKSGKTPDEALEELINKLNS